METRWTLVGDAPDGSGLLAYEGVAGDGTARRLVAEPRGGVAWPFPRQLGTEMACGGGCVVLAFVPGNSAAETAAHVLHWSPCTTVGVRRDKNGWPVDQGIAGRLWRSSVEFGCRRWYALCADDEQDDAMRCVRQVMKQETTPAIRVTAIGFDTEKIAREVAWRWGNAQRLHLPADLLAAIGQEEARYAGEGPMPITIALAAAIKGWELSPWRRRPEEPWRPLRHSEVNVPVRI
jgi:hypothetical protein